jgi:hypothetical protein
MDGTSNSRMSRRTSLKPKRSNTATNVRPNSRLTTRNRNGKNQLLRLFAPSAAPPGGFFTPPHKIEETHLSPSHGMKVSLE